MTNLEAVANLYSACDGHHYFPRDPKGNYLTIVRGQGIYIFDVNGRAILDGASGAAVCCLGHGNLRIAERLAQQARVLAFAHGSQFVSPQVLELADQLAARSPCPNSRVYFASGGSEATETALKIALAYHSAAGAPSRRQIVSRSISYHGATLGALAMTGHLHRRKLYESLLPPFPKASTCYCYRCPHNLVPSSCSVECAGDLQQVLTSGVQDVAAVILEPVIGASAPAVAAPVEYMRRVVETCRGQDTLLIADEVMSGVGRTGRFFAMEHYGVSADITVLSKALSAGYSPLAAVIVSGRVYERIRDGGPQHLVHGFTYSGNPLSAAVGLEVLAILDEEGLIPRASEMGRRLLDQLRSLYSFPMVGDVRGKGLLLGIEFVADRETRLPFKPEEGVAWKVQRAALEEGLWIYGGSGSNNGTSGDHILIAPPYTISEMQIDELVQKLTNAIRVVQADYD